MPIIIRKAELDDYDKLLDIFSEVDELHRLGAPWKFRKSDGPLFSKDYYQKMLENPDAIFILAQDGKELVGFCFGTSAKEAKDGPTLQKRNYGFVEDLGIRSNYQKQGVGTLLMNEFEKLAKEKGLDELELNVYSFNRNAIDFYEKKGYEAFSQKMRKVLKK